MTTPPKAQRYRLKRPGKKAAAPEAPQPGAAGAEAASQAPQGEQAAASQAMSGAVDSPAQLSREAAIEAIRKEGLTGRQLRMARRIAQKRLLPVTSDYDAVFQLREMGIDPFKRSNIMELVTQGRSDSSSDKPEPAVQLPQTVQAQGGQNLPSTNLSRQAIIDKRAGELRALQKELARRRQRNVALLLLRLVFFIVLPTVLAGYYFYRAATPMYATNAQFVIQQAEPASAGGGLGGLFQGTSMATQQDAIAVQSYLGSREAMLRLDEEHGFREHFTDPSIDPLQRLAADASLNDAYKVYKKRVELSYDPTEGLVRVIVSARSPEKSLEFTTALITYAEEMVDQMTARLRKDQMSGALENYESAESERESSLAKLTALQTEFSALDPTTESASLLGRISGMESERDTLSIELAGLLDNPRPNTARVNATRARMARIDEQIERLRGEISNGRDGQLSQTERGAIIRAAEENYQSRLMLVQQALMSLEAARQKADSQVRYLSMSVRPIPPDAPTYPRGFENTAVAFLVFCGIYLMIALTAAVIREQLSA